MALSIVLVDDSKVVRTMLKRFLCQLCGEENLEFREAGNGIDALELLRKIEPDVGFLDLTMPGMTGYDVLEALQKEGLSRKLFVLSADVQPEAVAKVHKLGALGFLPKPFQEEQLKVALKENKIL